MSIPKQRPPYQRRRRDSSGDRVSSSISGVSSASELNLPSCFLHRSEAPSYDRLKENFLREGKEVPAWMKHLKNLTENSFRRSRQSSRSDISRSDISSSIAPSKRNLATRSQMSSIQEPPVCNVPKYPNVSRRPMTPEISSSMASASTTYFNSYRNHRMDDSSVQLMSLSDIANVNPLEVKGKSISLIHQNQNQAYSQNKSTPEVSKSSNRLADAFNMYEERLSPGRLEDHSDDVKQQLLDFNSVKCSVPSFADHQLNNRLHYLGHLEKTGLEFNQGKTPPSTEETNQALQRRGLASIEASVEPSALYETEDSTEYVMVNDHISNSIVEVEVISQPLSGNVSLMPREDNHRNPYSSGLTSLMNSSSVSLNFDSDMTTRIVEESKDFLPAMRHNDSSVEMQSSVKEIDIHNIIQLDHIPATESNLGISSDDVNHVSFLQKNKLLAEGTIGFALSSTIETQQPKKTKPNFEHLDGSHPVQLESSHPSDQAILGQSFTFNVSDQHDALNGFRNTEVQEVSLNCRIPQIDMSLDGMDRVEGLCANEIVAGQAMIGHKENSPSYYPSGTIDLGTLRGVPNPVYPNRAPSEEYPKTSVITEIQQITTATFGGGDVGNEAEEFDTKMGVTLENSNYSFPTQQPDLGKQMNKFSQINSPHPLVREMSAQYESREDSQSQLENVNFNMSQGNGNVVVGCRRSSGSSAGDAHNEISLLVETRGRELGASDNRNPGYIRRSGKPRKGTGKRIDVLESAMVEILIDLKRNDKIIVETLERLETAIEKTFQSIEESEKNRNLLDSKLRATTELTNALLFKRLKASEKWDQTTTTMTEIELQHERNQLQTKELIQAYDFAHRERETLLKTNLLSQIQTLNNRLLEVTERFKHPIPKTTRIQAELERANGIAMQAMKDFDSLVNNPPRSTIETRPAGQSTEVIQSLWNVYENSLRKIHSQLEIDQTTGLVDDAFHRMLQEIPPSRRTSQGSLIPARGTRTPPLTGCQIDAPAEFLPLVCDPPHTEVEPLAELNAEITLGVMDDDINGLRDVQTPSGISINGEISQVNEQRLHSNKLSSPIVNGPMDDVSPIKIDGDKPIANGSPFPGVEISFNTHNPQSNSSIQSNILQSTNEDPNHTITSPLHPITIVDSYSSSQSDCNILNSDFYQSNHVPPSYKQQNDTYLFNGGPNLTLDEEGESILYSTTPNPFQQYYTTQQPIEPQQDTSATTQYNTPEFIQSDIHFTSTNHSDPQSCRIFSVTFPGTNSESQWTRPVELDSPTLDQQQDSNQGVLLAQPPLESTYIQNQCSHVQSQLKGLPTDWPKQPNNMDHSQDHNKLEDSFYGDPAVLAEPFSNIHPLFTSGQNDICNHQTHEGNQPMNTKKIHSNNLCSIQNIRNIPLHERFAESHLQQSRMHGPPLVQFAPVTKMSRTELKNIEDFFDQI